MNKALDFVVKRKYVLYFLFLLIAGLYSVYFQIFGFNLSHIIGDYGDSRFINAIIEYNYQWLIGNYPDYWDGFFMYPDKEVISYSDNLLGITPLYALFRIFNSNFLTAYQLLLLFCHILNFITCYYSLYKLTGSKLGAVCGAFIFAFNVSLHNVHNHPQFLFRFSIPLIFLHLILFLKTTKGNHFIYFCVFLALQFYLGIYLGYLSVVVSIFVFFGTSILSFKLLKNIFTLRVFLYLLSGIFLLLGLIAPLFYYYYKRSLLTGYYFNYDEILQTLPQLKSYLYPFYSSVYNTLLADIQVHCTYPYYQQLFPGFIILSAILIAIYILFKRKIYSVELSLIVLSLTLLFFTNYNGKSLYYMIQYIPGIQAIRIVSRIILVSTFFYSLLLAGLLSAIVNRNLKYVFMGVMPFLLFIDNYCSPERFVKYEKKDAFARITALEEKVKSSGKNSTIFAYMPKTDEPTFIIHTDAMQAALRLNYYTVNGYSSSTHGKFTPFYNQLDSAGLKLWLDEFNVSMDNIIIVK